MILLIDNYDSFTFNLYQLVGSLNPDIRVVRNDALSVDEVIDFAPQRIVISPGPGYPADAGICVELVRELANRGVPGGALHQEHPRRDHRGDRRMRRRHARRGNYLQVRRARL